MRISWIAKGDILLKQDEPESALAAFERTLVLHRKEDGEPLPLQVRCRAALIRSLEKRDVTPSPAPP